MEDPDAGALCLKACVLFPTVSANQRKITAVFLFYIITSHLFSEHFTYGNINGVLLLRINVCKYTLGWICVHQHYFLFGPFL